MCQIRAPQSDALSLPTSFSAITSLRHPEKKRESLIPFSIFRPWKKISSTDAAETIPGSVLTLVGWAGLEPEPWRPYPLALWRCRSAKFQRQTGEVGERPTRNTSTKLFPNCCGQEFCFECRISNVPQMGRLSFVVCSAAATSNEY